MCFLSFQKINFCTRLYTLSISNILFHALLGIFILIRLNGTKFMRFKNLIHWGSFNKKLLFIKKLFNIIRSIYMFFVHNLLLACINIYTILSALFFHKKNINDDFIKFFYLNFYKNILYFNYWGDIPVYSKNFFFIIFLLTHCYLFF